MKLKVWVELGSACYEEVLDIPEGDVHMDNARLQLEVFDSYVRGYVDNKITCGYEVLPDDAVLDLRGDHVPDAG